MRKGKEANHLQKLLIKSLREAMHLPSAGFHTIGITADNFGFFSAFSIASLLA
jgi:hypothetical protein